MKFYSGKMVYLNQRLKKDQYTIIFKYIYVILVLFGFLY